MQVIFNFLFRHTYTNEAKARDSYIVRLKAAFYIGCGRRHCCSSSASAGAPQAGNIRCWRIRV